MNRELNKSWKKRKPLIFIFVLAGIALLIWILMLLWNAILPDVVGVKTISYWQAMGIFVLSKILFGGFRGGKPRSRKHSKHKEKFLNLTEEQKESFKSEWQSRCQ